LTWLLYLLFSTVTSRFSFREGGFMCFTIRYVHKVWSPLFWHKMIMLIYSYINWNVIVLNVLWSCVELIDYVWIQILISRIQRLSLSLSLTHTRTHKHTLWCDSCFKEFYMMVDDKTHILRNTVVMCVHAKIYTQTHSFISY
jgi:hypothetical protein